MKEYKGVSALKKAAMNILVKMADNKDIEKLREAFISMDLDSTGDIRADELKLALKTADFCADDDEIEAIINEVDYGGDRIINYTEFLSATISVKEILTEQRLLAIFKYFDTSDTGTITAANIEDGMKKMGFPISNKELKEIMQKHDLTHKGSINL
jgi:calcium-dependent protein kinase